MYHEDDLDLRLDANGNPDMRFYINEAHRLRGEAIRELAVQAATGLRRQIRQLFHALHLDGHLASPHH